MGFRLSLDSSIFASDVKIYLDQDGHDRRIAAVFLIIREEVASDLSVSAMAQRVHLSPSHLAHLFKSETRLSIILWVKGYRIAQTVNLLTETELSIKEIAASLGFSSTSSFARVFKKHAGCSPAVMRKSRNWQ